LCSERALRAPGVFRENPRLGLAADALGGAGAEGGIFVAKNRRKLFKRARRRYAVFKIVAMIFIGI
jgi:hypothetical protein